MAIESKSSQYGTVFDGWQITKKLGRGSNGKTAVYQLSRKDDDWEETCALKVITLIEEKGVYEELSPARQKEYKQALKTRIYDAKQEVRLMEKLRGNTNIVDYLDHKPRTWKKANSFGCDMMIRMELLHDLRSEIASRRIFTEAEILKIGKDICNALILCHGKDILHRDIKPENIFFNDDGNYKLGDFGVSRILDACPDATASTGIGTYEYWPAEQMTGRYDKRVDIYSLGLVLYELCNRNRLPFAASTYLNGSEVPMRLAGKPLPVPSEASPALAEVIMKACAFKPDERYQSAEAFLKALNQVNCNTKAFKSDGVSPMRSEQVMPHNDYATVLAKELGLPEDIFSDDTYKTVSAQAYDAPQKTPFASQPAQPGSTSYKNFSAEQIQAQERPIKYKNGNKTSAVLFSAIALFLLIFIGTMASTILIWSDRSKKGEGLPVDTEFTESGQTKDGSVSPTSPMSDPIETVSQVSATTESEIPTAQSVKMQTVYLRTSCTNEWNDIFYEYNDDGTLYRFANRASGNYVVNYYIYDDGTLMNQIDALNAAVSTESDRTAMIQELNAILNHPSDTKIQYRILVLDDRGYPIRETFLNDALSLQMDSYIVYDNEGKKVKLDTYYSDNTIGEVHHNYQYDTNGKLTRSEHICTGPNSINNTTEYIYDADGRVSERKNIDFWGTSEASAGSKTITRWKYAYDTNGLLSETVAYSDWGTATGAYCRYTYDNVGNIIQLHDKRSADTIDSYYYAYKEIQIPVNQLDRLQVIYKHGLFQSLINIPDKAA